MCSLFRQSVCCLWLISNSFSLLLDWLSGSDLIWGYALWCMACCEILHKGNLVRLFVDFWTNIIAILLCDCGTSMVTCAPSPHTWALSSVQFLTIDHFTLPLGWTPASSALPYCSICKILSKVPAGLFLKLVLSRHPHKTYSTLLYGLTLVVLRRHTLIPQFWAKCLINTHALNH